MSEAKKLPLFLNIKEAGSSLEEVAVDLVKSEDEELISHWYHSPLDVDLYLWLDSKRNIIKQQLSIYGQICEWNILDGIRTGYVVEDESGHPEVVTTIAYDSSVQSTSVFQTLELLNYAELVPQDFKSVIISNYKNNPIIDDLDPMELLARYGDRFENKKGSLAKFLKKLFK